MNELIAIKIAEGIMLIGIIGGWGLGGEEALWKALSLLFELLWGLLRGLKWGLQKVLTLLGAAWAAWDYFQKTAIALWKAKKDAKAAKKLEEQRRKEAQRRRSQGISVSFLVSDLDQMLAQEFGDKYNEETTFQDVGGWLWGSREEGAARFQGKPDFLGHATMENPDTAEPGVSLCEAIAAKFPRHVSSANVFISWTWRYSVKALLEALRKYCADRGLDTAKTFVWLCFLCNNQHEWLSGAPNDGVEGFGGMIERIGKVVCVVDSFSAADAVYFRRLWTVFEVFIALTKNIPIDLALMSDAEQRLFVTAFGQLKESLIVDVMNATATEKEDEDKIKLMIQRASNGSQGVNDAVKQLFLKLFNKLLE